MCSSPHQQLLPYLPPRLRAALAALAERRLTELEEIRLKPGCPALCRFRADEAPLPEAGSTEPLLVSQAELRQTLLLLADSSLYALEEELRRGYLTLPGGHRAGLCGRAVLERGAVRTLKEISSINLRLARPVIGAAQPLLPLLLDGEGQLLSTLLVSPPRAGKTTLLRDLARLLADGEGVAPLRVGLADERSELAAVRQGQPQLPVGLRTDVLDGCPKAEALLMLVRSMSPEVLVTDEIGSEADVRALREAAAAGVRVVASAHGRDEGELAQRPALAGLLAEGAFRRLVILSRRLGPGTVERVVEPVGGRWAAVV